MNLNCELKSVLVGAEVRGIDLKFPVNKSVIEAIRDQVTEYSILIFKNQGLISAARHVEISEWFGDVIAVYSKHPKSPHHKVFLASNDPSEGFVGQGRHGWHIDGAALRKPHSFAIYQMVSVPIKGDTRFISLYKLVEDLSPEMYEKWDRLWAVICNEKQSTSTHPLIYSHPVNGRKTLCLHVGFTKEFIWDYGTPQQRTATPEETEEIKREINQQITRQGGEFLYSHKWEIGDFVITDNLAVGHEASPESQFAVCDVGLRVLHRTTVDGTAAPVK